MTQQVFADEIGVKQNTVAQYEIGRNIPIDTVLNNICKTFNVNREWLEHGTGEMFIEMSRDEELSNWVGRVLGHESEAFKRRFLAALSRMDSNGWDALEQFIEDFKND